MCDEVTSPSAAGRRAVRGGAAAGQLSAPLCTGPLRRTWFASDFHLHRDDPDGVRRAVRFVEAACADGAEALFLLGDVFRAWLGAPSLRDAGLSPFLESLRRAVGHGLRVVLLHGNHDFLMGAELERSCGVEVHAHSLDIALHGRRVRLLHGDAFCTLDTSYHALHRVLRSLPLRWLFRVLPAQILEALAERLMRQAGRSTVVKPPEVMDIVDAQVVEQLASGVDTIVCGHVHRARDERLGPAPDGRLVVLADFERSGCHARFDTGRLVLHRRDARFAPAGPVLAVDGPAGSGKSSVCRALAARLGWILLDSGALYRAVTAEALDRGWAPDDPHLGAWAAGLELSQDLTGGVLVGGRPVPDERLRSEQVSAAVSRVSAHPGVRAALLPIQRQAACLGPGLVAEGRDMATVVFPDAVLAVFLDARPEVRAARRLAQNPGEGRSLEEVTAALAARDQRDAGRAIAPLAVAPRAVRLDTSELHQEAVVERLLEILLAALERSGRGGRAGRRHSLS